MLARVVAVDADITVIDDRIDEVIVPFRAGGDPAG